MSTDVRDAGGDDPERGVCRRVTRPALIDVIPRNEVVIGNKIAETDDRVTTFITKKCHQCNTSVVHLVQILFTTWGRNP